MAAKTMTIEELEEERRKIREANKEITKKLENERRKAKRKAEAEAKRLAEENEQKEALKFYKFCKEHKLQGGITIFNWVKENCKY